MSWAKRPRCKHKENKQCLEVSVIEMGVLWFPHAGAQCLTEDIEVRKLQSFAFSFTPDK